VIRAAGVSVPESRLVRAGQRGRRAVRSLRAVARDAAAVVFPSAIRGAVREALHDARPKRALGAALFLTVGFFAFAGEAEREEKADWVFVNGTIVTLAEGATGGERAGALAVQGGRVAFVGDSARAAAWIGPQTRVIDLHGGTIVPGLVDAHFHLHNFGLILRTVDVVGTTSWREVVDRVVARAEAPGAAEWIIGRGWDQNDWETKAFPTSAAIDSLLPGRPVFIERVDGHAALASAAALERAGIRAGTPDPEGGRIVRDAAGRPTGVLVDRATDAVRAIVPLPTPAEEESLLALAMRTCAAAGLTGVHEIQASAATIEALARMDATGRLPIRVYAFIDADDPGFLRVLEAGPRMPTGKSRLTVRGFKIELDGAMGSRGAALLAPYSDEPGVTGNLRFDEQEFARLAGIAWSSGFQVATHAIGDRANRLVLDTYEALGKADGGARGVADRRPRIEHAQVVAPEDIPRFGRLGVIASMQPTHATSDMYWAEVRVGAARLAGAYAWRTLLASGAHLAFGSDCPVESHDPRLGLYAAITRQDAKRWPEGGWRPQERLTAREALEGFTKGAAYASFQEDRLGTLEMGKDADFTLLSGNPLVVDAAEIPRLRVLGTWVGGDLVSADPQSWLAAEADRTAGETSTR
jgi:predicted amidohydrolase YtcJ